MTVPFRSLLWAVALRSGARALSVQTPTAVDRPLLRDFGRGIDERVRESKEGKNRSGSDADCYTSAETIPTLNMEVVPSSGCGDDAAELSTRHDIHRAYAASIVDGKNGSPNGGGPHGRSSGSGCAVVRLTGEDAASIRGLAEFADDFFDGVDDDDDAASRDINDLGVFRVENNVHAGFDKNVNMEGTMQVLYTKLIPHEDDDVDPILLPLEVEQLVGKRSLRRGHRGMRTLFDVGSQITSALLGTDDASTRKLLDDCTRSAAAKGPSSNVLKSDNVASLTDNMSNSYQRLIRYLEPRPGGTPDEPSPSFWPHVDSTFLTLIPMTEIEGLEVWCPSLRNAECEDLSRRGEWVRPKRPEAGRDSTDAEDDEDDEDAAYVVALAGEFLQLLSDGRVPTCIHRVVVPRPPATPSAGSFGFGSRAGAYKPRVSAPLFLRPRRTEDAVFDAENDVDRSRTDLRQEGVYFQRGLLEECAQMRVWDYMDCMSPHN